MINVGLCGFGSMAKGHAQTLQLHDGVKLVAIADTVEDNRKKAEEQYGVKTYCTGEELIDAGGLDAVFVVVPTYLHAPLAIRALEAGCEKVVLILTRPRDKYRDPIDDLRFVRMLAPKRPRIAEALANRAGLYNLQLDLAKKYEREGKVLIVAPDDISGMSTLTKDLNAIESLYAKGYADAFAIADYL